MEDYHYHLGMRGFDSTEEGRQAKKRRERTSQEMKRNKTPCAQCLEVEAKDIAVSLIQA